MITIDKVGTPEPDDMTMRINNAQNWALTTKHYLRQALNQISTINMSDEHHQRNQLLQCIEDHARAVARAEMLIIMASEDFFIAMARSASKIGSS